jgi:hypothetical protein
MNSNLMPLLYPLQPGYKDADQWIDQLLNRPDTINWQCAFTHPLGSDKVGACIFDVNPNIGLKVYEKFFTLNVKSLKKIVPGKPYVYEFEYDTTYEPEDVVVMEALNLEIADPLSLQMAILK